jgi:hypothetical protein
MKTTKLFLSLLMMVCFVSFSSVAFSQDASTAKYIKGINEKMSDLDKLLAKNKNESLPEYASYAEKLELNKKDVNAKLAEYEKADASKMQELQSEIQTSVLNYRKLVDFMTRDAANAEPKK